jgi:hypothetical protein
VGVQELGDLAFETEEHFFEEWLRVVRGEVRLDVSVELKIALLVCDVTVRAPSDDLEVVEHLERNLFLVFGAGLIGFMKRFNPAQRCHTQAAE